MTPASRQGSIRRPRTVAVISRDHCCSAASIASPVFLEHVYSERRIIKGDSKSATIATASTRKSSATLRSMCVTPTMDSRIRRVTRCRLIVRRSRGLVHARLTGGGSDLYARPSVCRHCRLGLRHPSVLPAELQVVRFVSAAPILAATAFRERHPWRFCQTSSRDRLAGAARRCWSIPRISLPRPTKDAPSS
jgi:hypothetical protein